MGGTDGNEVFSDVWRLDLLSMAWTRLALTLPTPLYFHDAALTKVVPHNVKGKQVHHLVLTKSDRIVFTRASVTYM